MDNEDFIPDRDSIFNDDFDYPEYDEMYDLSAEDEALNEWVDYDEHRESERDLIDEQNDRRLELGLEPIPYEETYEQRRERIGRDEDFWAERWAGQDRHGEHSSTRLGSVLIEALMKARDDSK